MYNKWQVRSWYRGINKAVDLVTMLRFVLALENWVWAKIKRVYRWFTETLLRPLLEIAKWVLGICAYETTTMIFLTDQQTKDSSCAIPNAQSNLNWISYIWKRNFFPMSSRLQFSFEYISHCHMGLSTLPWRMINWRKRESFRFRFRFVYFVRSWQDICRFEVQIRK